MNYQVGTVLPYWFKTQILRKKGLTSPTLYKHDEYSERHETHETDYKGDQSS
jgi:hypothetical protein